MVASYVALFVQNSATHTGFELTAADCWHAGKCREGDCSRTGPSASPPHDSLNHQGSTLLQRWSEAQPAGFSHTLVTWGSSEMTASPHLYPQYTQGAAPLPEDAPLCLLQAS